MVWLGSVRFGSVRFGSVRFGSVRGGGGGGCRWLRRIGNISVLNHEGEPMDITQARLFTRVCTSANFAQDNILISVNSLE